MRLRSSPPSPFGRKIKLAARHLGLFDQIEVITTSTEDPNDPVRKDNPLGKIPVLILDNGQTVYDSRVILETLDHMAGGGKIIPKDWDARLKALTLQALADGIMDASILVVYEARMRPEELRHEPWVERQRDKIRRGLKALEANPPALDDINVGNLTVACALGYLDFRKQVDWRAENPGLIAWLDAFRAKTLAYDATAPH